MPRRPATDPKKTIAFYLPESQINLLRTEAAGRGISTSAYLGLLIKRCGEYGIGKTDRSKVIPIRKGPPE